MQVQPENANIDPKRLMNMIEEMNLNRKRKRQMKRKRSEMSQNLTIYI